MLDKCKEFADNWNIKLNTKKSNIIVVGIYTHKEEIKDIKRD
jgi:hypothetical protein